MERTEFRVEVRIRVSATIVVVNDLVERRQAAVVHVRRGPRVARQRAGQIPGVRVAAERLIKSATVVAVLCEAGDGFGQIEIELGRILNRLEDLLLEAPRAAVPEEGLPVPAVHERGRVAIALSS